MPHSSKIQKEFAEIFMEGDLQIQPISPFRFQLETWRREKAWQQIQEEVFTETQLSFQKLKPKKASNSKKSNKK